MSGCLESYPVVQRLGMFPHLRQSVVGGEGAASTHTAVLLFAGHTLCHLTPLVRMRFSTKRPSVKAHG